MRWRLPLPVLIVISAMTLATSSCLSPTLPLPPPEQPDSIQPGTTADTWQISGTCRVGATITVEDQTTGVGVLVEDRAKSGNYSVTLAGKQCDLVRVVELFMEQESEPTYFTLAPHNPGDPIDNPLCH